ncbi:proliferating cell nuclear antigen [Clydaea vesicula]|uniref:DNA sliding clamp PCNA n=1 Tax=Clydaea vesicula TaxID=447962 RepID=A0AAD5U9S5_9FUNG|nr:proliferating cell nuclear antigen [Clydaea vesicula]KAJ3392901.1 proliferating cell nuclear antigen [Lobulomyces angularis]
MLEARLQDGVVLKKVLDALKDLINEANFDCNETGLSLQAMDNAHVALVSLLIKAESFDPFRCDRSLSLGISLTSLSKILKCSGPSDVLTLKASDQIDTLHIMFEGKDSERVSEFDLKLMDIDSEHLGIPDTEYDVCVNMCSLEFQRICRDLSVLGESVTIECSKESIKFSANGDIGSGAIQIKQGATIDEKKELTTTINVNTPVLATYSLKYLVNFTKATGLSDVVNLSISNELPIVVEYKVSELGYIRYFLAPKIGDDEE